MRTAFICNMSLWDHDQLRWVVPSLHLTNIRAEVHLWVLWVFITPKTFATQQLVIVGGFASRWVIHSKVMNI